MMPKLKVTRTKHKGQTKNKAESIPSQQPGSSPPWSVPFHKARGAEKTEEATSAQGTSGTGPQTKNKDTTVQARETRETRTTFDGKARGRKYSAS